MTKINRNKIYSELRFKDAYLPFQIVLCYSGMMDLSCYLRVLGYNENGKPPSRKSLMIRINQTEKLFSHGKNLTLFSFYFTCFFSEKKEKESGLSRYFRAVRLPLKVQRVARKIGGSRAARNSPIGEGS
ncbi:hypothetical protein ACRS7A_06070 [Bacillus cytotoxicus]|uniref:hypothetical protein n=1 Tax=Bacillus cytotoxicus TaxID=580165 RepID=UPI003D7EEB25